MNEMNSRKHENEKEFYEWCEYHGTEYAFNLNQDLQRRNTLLEVKLQTAMSMNASLESDITKLREVLLKAGATTHKCQELFTSV